MNAFDVVLLVVFPYVAAITFVLGTIYRRRQKGFTVSSLSSQFLEGNPAPGRLRPGDDGVSRRWVDVPCRGGHHRWLAAV